MNGNKNKSEEHQSKGEPLSQKSGLREKFFKECVENVLGLKCIHLNPEEVWNWIEKNIVEL